MPILDYRFPRLRRQDTRACTACGGAASLSGAAAAECPTAPAAVGSTGAGAGAVPRRGGTGSNISIKVIRGNGITYW